MSEASKDQNAPAPVPVEVVIGGRHYRLRGSDPEQLRRLAAEVDATLAEVAGPSGAGDDFKAAVLAALNLAAEHDDDRQRWQSQVAELRARAQKLESRLQRLVSRIGDAALTSRENGV